MTPDNQKHMNTRWQWIDNHFGPMGWFSEAEKAKHQGTSEFSNGYWRVIPQSEVDSMSRVIRQLAYDQS